MTLSIFHRAYAICSNQRYLDEELHDSCLMFPRVNAYPNRLISNIMNQMKNK